jgi:hypothetical protein
LLIGARNNDNMRKIIKTDELTINDIPDDDADWSEISTFALRAEFYNKRS